MMRSSRDPASPGAVLDDAAVIARVLEGDLQQFARLVERYQTPLFRYAASMVLDHAAAADLVQDAFVCAYVRLASCRDRTRFRAWLFQMLRNRCLDYLKDVRRKIVPLDALGAVADAADRPDACVERVRLREDIRGAVAALPDLQREAFVLRHVEGLAYEAMADLLGVSVSALKMRVLRAREALAAALEESRVTNAAPARLSITRG
jgi:RNA polymerase sigma-70 factor, ECF subfamily